MAAARAPAEDSPRPSAADPANTAEDGDWQVTDMPSPSCEPSSGSVVTSLGWQQDSEVEKCPFCERDFSTTFRRHHCRNCGRIVCDDCSKQRLRLPRHSKSGKVRVCDPCAVNISQSQATGFEEDLAVNNEIIEQLRGALSKSYADCEIFKRVLLDLDAEATGDSSLLEEHRHDPESHAASFQILKDRAQKQWPDLLESQSQQGNRCRELLERQVQAVERRDQALEEEKDLLARKASLNSELQEVDRVQAEKDVLVRKSNELEKALEDARRRVRELEFERREHQERQAQMQDRWRIGRLIRNSNSRGSSAQRSPPGSPRSGNPEPFTITHGQTDTWLQRRRGRLEGCRQHCVAM